MYCALLLPSSLPLWFALSLRNTLNQFGSALKVPLQNVLPQSLFYNILLTLTYFLLSYIYVL